MKTKNEKALPVDADGYCRQCNTYIDCPHVKMRAKKARAQARLNKAAKAWHVEWYCVTYNTQCRCATCKLHRAVRAFEKACK